MRFGTDVQARPVTIMVSNYLITTRSEPERKQKLVEAVPTLNVIGSRYAGFLLGTDCLNGTVDTASSMIHH